MASRCPGAAPRAGLGSSGISRLGAGTPSAGRMARPQSSPSPSSCPGVSASRPLTARASPLRPTGPARCKALQSESYSRRVRSLTGSTARRGAAGGACPSATSMASAASAASMTASPSRCRLPPPPPPAARARSPCPGQQSSAYAAPSPRAIAADATPRFNVSAPPRFAQRPAPTPFAAHTSCPATPDSWAEYSEPMLEDEEPPWEMSDAWDYDMDVGEEDEFYDDWENSGPSWSVGTSPPWPPPILSSTPRPAYYSTPAAGGPGACPVNPRCQSGGGDETSGAAETIIENLRCQEEHEVRSLMRNLADLQSFRRQALSHALPHTPFLRQPARPEQLAARLAARALPPPCAASSPRSGATPAAPLHGAYSRELFDAGRM